MIVCKSIRDKIAFRFIRLGFRIALKNKTEYAYLKYLFKGDTYTFESKEHRDLKSLLKTDEERLKSPCEMQIEVSKKLETTIKAEAVKEFAEVIKKNHGALFNTIYSKRFGEIIDNLAKEMVR